MADYRQSEDPACVEILFNRYCQLVFGVAMKYLQNQEESKDAVIALFEKVPADIRKYNINNFSNWIYIVTKNYCFLQLKKKKYHQKSSRAVIVCQSAEGLFSAPFVLA